MAMLRPVGLASGIALLLLVLSATPAPAAGVTLQVTAGFGGYGRLGAWLPLNVAIHNDGPDVRAELVAVSPASPALTQPQPSFVSRYSLSVSLPHGAQKHFLLHVPLQTLSPTLEVQLQRGTTILAGASVPITVIGPDQVLVGLVSDQSMSLPALRQVQLPSVSGAPRTLRVTPIAPPDLPGFSEELSDFAVLLFSQASTDRLSPDQRLALEGWVARGGFLVLSGGSDWSAISGGLPANLLPVQQPALRVLPDLAALAGFAGTVGKVSDPTVVTTGAIQGRVLAQQDGVPLLALLAYGQGAVAFSAADLAGPPLSTWPGAPALWQHLLLLGLPPAADQSASIPQPVYYDPKANLTYALSNVPPASQPTWQLLGGILVLYLLAAPGSWLLFRRLGRPALTWIALPTLAVAFAGWTYAVAFRERGSVAIVNAITTTEYPANAAVGQVTSFLGFFAPSDQAFRVRFATPALLTSVAMPIYKRVLQLSAPPPALGLAIGEDGPQVDLLPTPQWMARAVRTARWIPGPSGIETHLTSTAAGLVGTVTNHTGRVLRDCALATPWGGYWLGMLPEGAAASFRLDRQPGSMPPLQQLYGYAPNQPPPPPAEQRRRQVQLQMLNTLWSSAGPVGSGDQQLGPLLFIGWSDPVPPVLTVDGRTVPEAGLGLLVVGLPASSADPAAVPAGLLVARFVAGDRAAMQKGNTLVLNGASLTVEARVPSPAPLLRSVTLRLTSPVGARSLAVTVAALNQWTGNYDPVPLTLLGGPPAAVATATPVPSVSPTPTAVARGKSTALAAVAKAVPIVSAPAPAQAVPPGPVVIEYDATLALADLRPYLDADNAVHFRITGPGPNTLLSWPVTYGYTTAGAP